MNADSAQNPHVLRVRSGSCVLAAPKLAAPMPPGDSS
ncbi:MAG TPA: DNA metabolism protein [Leclercia adecarboxylata]|nr:DNA metabolism protein [Leclercia adecarboxylata]